MDDTYYVRDSTVARHRYPPAPESHRVTKRVTIAIASGRHQWPLADGRSQVGHVAALASPIATWLRDEEADGSDRAACHSAILSALRPS